MASDATLALKDLEGIIGRMISANETRKREYTRWTAAGITAAVALLGIFLERIGHIVLGGNPVPSVLLIWIFAYVLTRIAWELLEGTILAAVRTILASEEPDARPWDRNIKNLFAIAEVPLSARRVVLSPIALSFVITLSLFVSSAILWSEIYARFLLYLAMWRFALFLIFIPLFRTFRRLGLKLLPEKERVKQALPAQFSAEELRRNRIGSAVSLLLIGAYYSVQLWLLWLVIEIALPLTYDVFQISLLALGVTAMLTWMRAVTWPLVELYSEGLRRLQSLHARVVSGALSDPAQVQSEIAALMHDYDSTR